MGVHFDLKNRPPEQTLIEQARQDAQQIVREYQFKTIVWISIPVFGVILSVWLREFYGLFAVAPCLYAIFICCDYSNKMHHAIELKTLLSERKGPLHPTLTDVILKDSLLQNYYFNIIGRGLVFAEEKLLMMKILEEEK